MVGVPKSGTTWIMNLLYTYLLLATGADPNHRSVLFALGHVKRVEFSCQYEFGEKRRNATYFDLDERVELAYRLLPGFSHVIRNQEKPGRADANVEHDELVFQRFFGVRRDKKHHGARHHEPPVGHRLAVWLNPTHHHYDTHCLLHVQVREPLNQALSACHYYPKICGGGHGEVNASAVRDVPSSSKHSIMVPFNATARWNRALAAVLRNATFSRPTELQMRFATTCPRLPYMSGRKGQDESAHELFFRRAQYLTYEQLRRDTFGELKRALLFFEYPVDDALINTTLRVVAARPQEELKVGLTTMRVADTFTEAQMRYIDDLARSVDPFYGDVVEASESGNALLRREPSHVAFTSSLSALAATNESRAAARAALNECWRNDSAWTAVFRNETCHRAWELHMIESAVHDVVSVQSITRVGRDSEGRENGAIGLHMADGRRALFKVCDHVYDLASATTLPTSFETWKAELIAHAVDRVLHVHRVPAVVPRSIRFTSLPLATADNEDAHERLKVVRFSCQNGRHVMHGALIGFTKFALERIKNYHTHFVEEHEFDLSRLSQPCIEFARVVISLFMCDLPHKYNHNIMTLVPEVVRRGSEPWQFLVGIDNDRAHWLRFTDSQVQLSPAQHEVPVCNRTETGDRFRCEHYGQGRVMSKVEMRHLASFLGSACVFPRDIAERIEAIVASGVRPSQLVHEYIVEQLVVSRRLAGEHGDDPHLRASLWPEQSAFAMDRWNSTVFDLRMRHIHKILTGCIERFGRERVLFDDTQHTFAVDAPPPQ
jgi:hypothetical protein